MIFAEIIQRWQNAVLYLGSIVLIFIRAFTGMFIAPFRFGHVFEQVKRIGMGSTVISMLVALFTGMIIAIQSAYQMQKVSAEMYIASLVSLSMVRELGPVLTAMIVAGRAGAAITAEIGTMKVTEQISALKTLAMDPVKFLISPRLAAMILSLPILVLMSNIIGIIGGYYVCVYNLNITGGLYVQTAFNALIYKDIVITVVKSVVFAILIAMISSFEGMRVEGGAEAVGEATMRAVVRSFISILIADWVFTTLFYFVF